MTFDLRSIPGRYSTPLLHMPPKKTSTFVLTMYINTHTHTQMCTCTCIHFCIVMTVIFLPPSLVLASIQRYCPQSSTKPVEGVGRLTHTTPVQGYLRMSPRVITIRGDSKLASWQRYESEYTRLYIYLRSSQPPPPPPPPPNQLSCTICSH